MGFLLVTAVLVVTFGRLGDQYGRARLFNLGFLIFTLASIGCALVPNGGGAGAMEIIVLRVVQGVGGAMVMANSTAIITDAFPPERRGFALGVNQVAALAGSFLGLIIGGVLSEWDWRAVFWVSVPVGVWGTWMGYRTLHDKPRDPDRRIVVDWWGNLTFGVGLIAVLVAITYGLQPYGGHTMGWTSPKVLTGLLAGVALLVAFGFVETRVQDPMINLRLFKIRAFAAGQAVNLLAAMSRGGLQFMLIIWLQGIWLPLHGYDFADTPLWAGIYMLPLTIGFLVAGPASGAVSDRFGARAFATGGLLLTAATFAGLIALPANFSYVLFAALLALNGIGMGLMAAPNTAAIMNAVPASERGAASGIRATGMNAGMVLSMGGFFTLMAIGLSSRLPHALSHGLTASGVSPQAADAASHVSPVGTLFAAFLGDNPIKELVPDPGPRVNTSHIYGQAFFPNLISDPFRHGLFIAFSASIIMLLVAAGASLMRGARYVHEETGRAETLVEATAREGDALAVPAVLGEDVAYDDAVRQT
jgi:MFS family permease